MNQRPSEEEYAGSSGEYIRLVPDGNIIDILLAQEKANDRAPWHR